MQVLVEGYLDFPPVSARTDDDSWGCTSLAGNLESGADCPIEKVGRSPACGVARCRLLLKGGGQVERLRLSSFVVASTDAITRKRRWYH